MIGLWRSVIFGCSFVFFQAEDGIRDLVRSRGLGDVYKRQVRDLLESLPVTHPVQLVEGTAARFLIEGGAVVGAVSYTHLTLPTSDLV